ncbi:Elongation factor Ts [Candidatus Nasuia deltocephalinicola]|nr:Elongation factor Ts [Candidatus Nasuia deltocephalinicola]
MKIDKSILKILRDETKISLFDCVNALKKYNNNIILAKKFLFNKNINEIKKKKNLYNIIYIFKYNKICLLIKCKLESEILIKIKEIINLIKKIIFILIINKYKNIFLLKKNYKLIKVKNIINILIIKIKENFNIYKFNIIKFINQNIIYNYNNKLGLIINYNKYYNNFLTKNICIHILILKPIFISLKSIYIEKIFNKYINIIIIKKKKIIINKLLNKLLKKYTLINQKFIKNNEYTIKNILKKKKIKIENFIIYK